MSFIAVAIGGAAAIGGALISSSASSSAADKQKSAADAATAEQARQYDLTRSDFAPYRASGTAAMGSLNGLLGLSVAPGAGTTAAVDPYAAQRQTLIAQIAEAKSKENSGGPWGAVWAKQEAAKYQKQLDALPAAPAASAAGTAATPSNPADVLSALRQTPGYKFALGEGQKGVERSAASRTGTLSGAATKAMANYNMGMADTTYNDAVSRMMNMAQIGEGSTATLGQIGANTANQISSNTIGAGNAGAAGTVASGNAWSGALGGIGTNISNLAAINAMNKSSYAPISPNSYNEVPSYAL